MLAPDPTTPWLLLPVKSMQTGKGRLAPALSSSERRALNEFFLRRMIALVSSYPGLHKTAIISDAADTLDLAAALGVGTIRQGHAHDLNQAVTQGCHHLYARGATDILILPVDLPLIQPADIQEIAGLGRRHSLVICPDKNRVGTNAIFLSAQATIRFQFGPQSYIRHQDEARLRGYSPCLHFNPRIAIDIDVPDDLIMLDERMAPTRALISIDVKVVSECGSTANAEKMWDNSRGGKSRTRP